MKELNFPQRLFEPTVDGRMRSTLRRYNQDEHAFAAGEIVKGVFEGIFEGGKMNVLLRITADTEVKSFLELADEEAQENGFDNAADAFVFAMETCCFALSDADKLAIIRYEVLHVRGEPVVSLL